MGYYIRVLTKSHKRLPVSALTKRLELDSIPATIEVESGTEKDWAQLVIKHTDTKAASADIAVLEWNPVESGSLGEEELAEFIEDVQDCEPETGTKWLTNYLRQVKGIYGFQILHSGADWGGGWEAVRALHGEIWETLGGIFQADMEGFSNENGHHILWQFSENVKGPWEMAVLDEDGKWVAFEMDLGSPEQCDAFLAGRVPPGVRLL